MTEDEAKTKVCHRSIDGDDSPAPVIGNEMFAKKFACIGSACMAWRWGWDQKPDWKPAVTPEEYLQRDADANIGYVRSQTTGYCGLAGKP